jgi:uncharacterized protein YndB with AHSA1/START domain
MKKAAEPRRSGDISDAAVQARTGKTWAEWFTLLDRAGATKLSHRQIALYLHEQKQLSPWWCQMVTVCYERDRGLREKYQKCDGNYSASASKTIAVPVGTLYTAWQDDRARGRWLPGVAFTIRKATPNKRLHITWTDGKSTVEVAFYAKGDAKSQVTVQHDKLANAKEVERMKAYWTAALERLKESVSA